MPKLRSRKRTSHRRPRPRELPTAGLPPEAMAGIRLVQRVNDRERAGDAAGALDVMEKAPFSPSGGPMWTRSRTSRLLEVATYDSLLPSWAVARWVRAQALGDLGRPGSQAILEAFRDARRAHLGDATGARPSTDPVDAQCQVADHDWVFGQSYLYDHDGLRTFLGQCAPELVARASDIETWSGTVMGAFRFVRDEATAITWHDLAADREVSTVNLGTVATLHPGDHVIGRRVTSAGESLFDAAPLMVARDVAEAVAADPVAWVDAVSERGEGPIGPRVRRGAWRGGPSGLLTDLSDSVWKDLARLHGVGRGGTSEAGGDRLVAACTELVIAGVEDTVLTPHSLPLRDAWPAVGAALEYPGVWDCLVRRLEEDHELVDVAALGERLGGVIGRSLCSLTMVAMARSR